MRACLFLALLAATVAANPLKTYRSRVKEFKKEERKYWNDFRNDFNAAYQAWVAPTSGRGGVDPEATNDFTDLRSLVDENRQIQAALAKAYAEFATSGHAKAHEILFKEFLGTCKDIRAAENEIADANPVRRYLFDQRPTVLRDGLEIRLAGLVVALASWPDLATTGWTKARKLDGKKSVVRRVAVIDALALAGAKEALAGLCKSKEMPLRAALAESLFDRAPLVPLLGDKSPIVRRALLAAITSKGRPRWIGPVIGALKRARGQEAIEAVAALRALSGQPFGHDAAKWSEWHDEYKKEIDEGRFDKTKIEIQETQPKPPEEHYAFYGIASSSRAVAVVTLGSSIMSAPVDWNKRREKNSWDWATTRKQWESEALPSHRAYFAKQFEGLLDRFPSKGVYGVVLLQNRMGTETTEKMLGLAKRDVAVARKLVDKIAGRGWCSPMRGLHAAAALGPVDTIYLVNDGELQGGNYITPELVVAAFKRWNRFRRIVLHAVRIDNQKEPGETLMKGLAEVSGGSYIWLKAPLKG